MLPGTTMRETNDNCPLPIRRVLVPGFAVLLVAAAGCGNQRGPVPISGTVTLDGEPVEGATVTFHTVGTDKEGKPATGETDKSGTFRLRTGTDDGVRPGEYKVVIIKSILADPNLKMPNFPDTPEGRNQKEHFLWEHFGDNRSPYRNVLP